MDAQGHGLNVRQPDLQAPFQGLDAHRHGLKVRRQGRNGIECALQGASRNGSIFPQRGCRLIEDVLQVILDGHTRMKETVGLFHRRRLAEERERG